MKSFQMKTLLAEFLGIEKEGGDGKYLGLPECFSGSKRELLAFIEEKLNKRLNGWHAKTLSLRGKEVLLKSVAMALPVYAMSCFRLTKHQCEKITNAMSSFWWNACDKQRKIYWVSWKEMCKSKAKGGLGFRDVRDFNQTLLAKQAWKILNEPESLLARLYKRRYFGSKDFLDCSKGYRPSYAWRSILFGRELLSRGLMKSVGDGTTTNVWIDKWVMDDHPRRPANKQILYDIDLKVAALISPNGTWRRDIIQELFPAADAKRILDMAIGRVKDRYIWAYTHHGAYTVKSGFWFLSNHPVIAEPAPNPIEQRQNQLKQRIWRTKTEPKIRFFLWRVISGALAVATRLQSRGMSVDTVCKLCRQDAENINHVLFKCTLAQDLFAEACIVPPLGGFNTSLEDNLTYVLDLLEAHSNTVSQYEAIPWLLWNIWKSRNSILYEGKQDATSVITQKLIADARAWSTVNTTSNIQISAPASTTLNARWQPPLAGTLKCNVNANWKNSTMLSGGAWIARDAEGKVLYHSREAFTSSPNRIIAEIRCIIWAIQSLRNLRCRNISIATDCTAVFDALTKPQGWPRYHAIIDHCRRLVAGFDRCVFELEAQSANQISREIARSVTRDGRFQSYLALGGPAWLHERLQREANVE